MRFHCATVLVECLRILEADDAMQMDAHKSLYLFFTTKKMSHVTVIITKNAALTAIARYI